MLQPKQVCVLSFATNLLFCVSLACEVMLIEPEMSMQKSSRASVALCVCSLVLRKKRSSWVLAGLCSGALGKMADELADPLAGQLVDPLADP